MKTHPPTTHTCKPSASPHIALYQIHLCVIAYRFCNTIPLPTPGRLTSSSDLLPPRSSPPIACVLNSVRLCWAKECRDSKCCRRVGVRNNILVRLIRSGAHSVGFDFNVTEEGATRVQSFRGCYRCVNRSMPALHRKAVGLLITSGDLH